jgi:DNA-binding NtrC family response regulator
MKYAFPGNIRELRNLLGRAHILGPREEISANELPVVSSDQVAPASQKMEMRDWIRTLPPSVELRELLTAFEKGLIERALEQANEARLKQLGCLDYPAVKSATRSQNMRSDAQKMALRRKLSPIFPLIDK